MNLTGYNSGYNVHQNKSTKSIFQKDIEKCNLFVYGYASKLYRDDERAEELEQGKHLIPWMGNETLKIDRYDVRGYLCDLSQFEKEFHLSMSEEEQQIEKMCDIERYHDLLSNEEEEEYREEEVKRQNQSLAKDYHQVSFKYDSSSPSAVNEECTGGDYCNGGADKTFTPSFLSNTLSAANIKEIIDKTAKCVSKHGRQMEIIIKTRQANNDKFNFLNRNNEFNSYYECVLKEFKNRQTQNATEGSKSDETNPNFKSDVTVSSFVESAPGKCKVPVLQNCPYSLIVDSIQNSQQKFN